MAYNKNASNKQKRTPRDIESQANEEIAYQRAYARRADKEASRERPRSRSERADRNKRRRSYDRVMSGDHGPVKGRGGISEPKSEQGAMSRFLEGMGLLRKFARKKQKGWQDLNNISVD